MRVAAYIARRFRSSKALHTSILIFGVLMKRWAFTLTACAGLLSFGSAAHAQRTTTSTDAEPCCNITAINGATRIVTAQGKAGTTFQFEVKDAALLRSLRVGQAVNANFTTGQVRIHGAEPCCAIVRPAVVKPDVTPAEPCCSVTAVDSATGIVTAKVSATGRVFRFEVKDRAMLASLKAGQGVWADFGTSKVRINGMEPCCSIVGRGPGDDR